LKILYTKLDLEKVWIMKQLQFNSTSLGNALEKLWHSNMKSDNYAEFLLEFQYPTYDVSE
jgi:hypothetical protein